MCIPIICHVLCILISTKYVSHSSLETLSEVLLKVKQTIFKLREQRINDKRNRKFKKNLKKNREPLNSSTNSVQMISLLSHTQKSKVGGNHAPFPVKCFFSSFTVIDTTTGKVIAFEYTSIFPFCCCQTLASWLTRQQN